MGRSSVAKEPPFSVFSFSFFSSFWLVSHRFKCLNASCQCKVLSLIHIIHKPLWLHFGNLLADWKKTCPFSTESSLHLFQFLYILSEMRNCIGYSRCRSRVDFFCNVLVCICLFSFFLSLSLSHSLWLSLSFFFPPLFFFCIFTECSARFLVNLS